jgi:alanyl aminopeptidase
VDPQQQASLLKAMAAFRDSQAIRLLLEAVLAGKLPVTPAAQLFLYAGMDAESTRRVRFDFLQAHFDQMLQLLGDSTFSGRSRLPNTGLGFCDSQSRKELQSYFEPRLKQLLGAPRVLAHVLEGIDQCIAIKDAQEPSVTAFLKKN